MIQSVSFDNSLNMEGYYVMCTYWSSIVQYFGAIESLILNSKALYLNDTPGVDFSDFLDPH